MSEEAERVGRGTAVQRDAERAHAHPQARGRSNSPTWAAVSSASTSSGRSSTAGSTSCDPFRYELVDIPFKFHHPMWRENCEVDLDYHVRPYRVDSPGGRRELDDAIGEIASTPLDRSRPLWEMYFIEGLANGRIAVLGKIHHALADGVASANLLARGMDLHPGPQPTATRTQPIPHRAERNWSARRSPTTCVRSAGCRACALHRAGHAAGCARVPASSRPN